MCAQDGESTAIFTTFCNIFICTMDTKWRWWMWMVAAIYRRTHSPSRLAWSEGWRPPGAQSAFISRSVTFFACGRQIYNHVRHISSGFCKPRIIKIGSFLTELFQNKVDMSKPRNQVDCLLSTVVHADG